MKSVRQLLWAFSLLAVSGICCSCGSEAGVSSAGLTDAQKQAAAEVQKGSGGGGAKAKNGGGVMPEPEAPKPGEHVGPPSSGGKAGGG